MTDPIQRSADGRFEIRYTSGLNGFVEMYGDSDEEQHDLIWEVVELSSGKALATFTGWSDHTGCEYGVKDIRFDEGTGALMVEHCDGVIEHLALDQPPPIVSKHPVAIKRPAEATDPRRPQRG